MDAFESRLMIKINEKLAENQPKPVKETKSVKIVSPPPKPTVTLNLQVNAQSNLNKSVQIREGQRKGKHTF